MKNLFVVLLFGMIVSGCGTGPKSLQSKDAIINVGKKKFTVFDSTRKRNISAYLWYPTKSKNTVSSRSGPFLPSVTVPDGKILKSQKKYPVVLVSHGSGGNAEKMFWMTQALVKKNIVVIGVDHPGNMIHDNSAKGVIEVWERAKDLSVALDTILKYI